VEFRLDVQVGPEVTLAELRREFDAVFLATEARQARPLSLPGAHLAGVHQALPFIIRQNTDYPWDTPPLEVAGKQVVVLGGGDTAMDALRTAIRARAASAVGVYRRDFASLPATRKDYWNAVEEGARLLFQAEPVEILGAPSGHVARVRCRRTELGAADAQGRPQPWAIPGSEFDVPADVVLVAYGFEPVPCPAAFGLPPAGLDEQGRVVVDARQMTAVPGVFAGGDLVHGPQLLVHSVRDARRAAKGIDAYLTPRRAPPPAAAGG
jgi:glutamate synthase (NADPH/NADH) small chain